MKYSKNHVLLHSIEIYLIKKDLTRKLAKMKKKYFDSVKQTKE